MMRDSLERVLTNPCGLPTLKEEADDNSNLARSVAVRFLSARVTGKETPAVLLYDLGASAPLPGFFILIWRCLISPGPSAKVEHCETVAATLTLAWASAQKKEVPQAEIFMIFKAFCKSVERGIFVHTSET